MRRTSLITALSAVIIFAATIPSMAAGRGVGAQGSDQGAIHGQGLGVGGTPPGQGTANIGVGASGKGQGTVHGRGVGVGGTPPGQGTAEEKDGGDEDEDGGGNALGKTVAIGGLRIEGYESHLRFSNFGKTSGSAHVMVLNSQTGAELTSWSSSAIAGHGALEIPFADILGGVKVPASDGGTAVSLTAAIMGDFKGHVQHVAWMAGPGVLSNLTACERLETPKAALGYVAGPGRSDVTGMIRLLNTGTQTGAVTLTLRDAATGKTLGTWMSPDLAPMGAWEGSVIAIASEASPAVPVDADALTVTLNSPTKHVALSYLETAAARALTDLAALPNDLVSVGLGIRKTRFELH
ncbi:MAG: hypothetical protein EXR11_10500 [Rhodospirillaceae bacterium]|nr:hypothetical protein [Rhodospirillaceae bacterium]